MRDFPITGNFRYPNLWTGSFQVKLHDLWDVNIRSVGTWLYTVLIFYLTTLGDYRQTVHHIEKMRVWAWGPINPEHLTPFSAHNSSVFVQTDFFSDSKNSKNAWCEAEMLKIKNFQPPFLVCLKWKSNPITKVLASYWPII